MSDKTELINLWDKVAKNFAVSGVDYWNRFGQRLVSLVNLEPNDKVLDIGTGRGATLFQVCKILKC